MSSIYFIESMSETFNKFQEFKSLVENQTRKHIHSLRYDNECDFKSHAFKDLCSDARICRQMIVPYNP